MYSTSFDISNIHRIILPLKIKARRTFQNENFFGQMKSGNVKKRSTTYLRNKISKLQSDPKKIENIQSRLKFKGYDF